MPNRCHEQRRRRALPVGAGRLTVSFRPLFLGGLLPSRARFRFAGRASARLALILAQSMPVNLSSFFLPHPWGAVQGPRAIAFEGGPAPLLRLAWVRDTRQVPCVRRLH